MSEGAASTAAAPVADDTKKSGWFSRLAKAVGEGFDYVAGIDDPDDLETVDDGAGETAADAEEDAGFNGERKALWKQLRGMMGADIMSLFSVPVFIMVRRAAAARPDARPVSPTHPHRHTIDQ
jgi:hypothetical protein